MTASAANRILDDTDNFPGWDKASAFLEALIVDNGFKAIGDIGGGANPMLSRAFIEKYGLSYTVFDIAQEELDKAPVAYRKVQMDVSCDDATFATKGIGQEFDLLFSHMFLEHIENSEQAHRNFARMLKPGGMSVHLYPSSNNFPLALNRIIPESVSTGIVRVLQKDRDLDGNHGKFKAYYRNCGAPSRRLEDKFNALGFDVVRHTGYVGHRYYERIPPLAAAEKQLRAILLKMQVPMTAYNLLMLRRRA